MSIFFFLPSFLLDDAKAWLRRETKKERPFLEVVHRLDRPVTGIVLFARSSKALSRLHEMQRRRSLRKQYHALVEGEIKQQEGVLEHALIHADHHARVASSRDLAAKQARLHYRCIWKTEKCSALEIELETGRYHQIRVQCAAIGHPICGDALYGSTQPYKKDAIALQHIRLECTHPVTQETLSLQVSRSLIGKDFPWKLSHS